jgi:general stress protein YciG
VSTFALIVIAKFSVTWCFQKRAKMDQERPKSRRGFASLTQEKRRAIASAGGKAAQAKGTAHRYTPEEARAAGRKGGLKVAENRKHMAEIGHKGGVQRGRNMLLKEVQES